MFSSRLLFKKAIWSQVVKKERKLRVLEGNVVNRIFVSRRDEMPGG
jgi:hypothetical protein